MVVVLVLPLTTLAVLEELRSSLGGARAYLDSLLPLLSDGIKAVQVIAVL